MTSQQLYFFGCLYLVILAVVAVLTRALLPNELRERACEIDATSCLVSTSDIHGLRGWNMLIFDAVASGITYLVFQNDETAIMKLAAAKKSSFAGPSVA